MDSGADRNVSADSGDRVALTRGQTVVTVRPSRSRMTTTTWRLPVCSSALRRSTRSAAMFFCFTCPPKCAPSTSLSAAPSEFDRALFGFDRFAQFVEKNERGLVLAIEIAAHLKGAVALHAVDEDRDRQKVVADRTLAIGENRAGRD